MEEIKGMQEMSFRELQEIVSICLDEIERVKEENQMLRSMLTSSNEKMIGMISALVRNTEEANSGIVKNAQYLSRAIENIKYEICDPNINLSNLFIPCFYDIEETIEMIISNRCSMARYGDGEFALMDNMKRQSFQRADCGLATRLQEVIRSNEDGFLIGIADNYGNLDKYNSSGKHGIRYYMTEEVRQSHMKYLDLERKYHNAYISRPYALFADNNTDAPRKRFDTLKCIWDKRDVIFVEGLLTRLGVGNDLFDNARSIRRIEAPAENSYDKYTEILEASLKWAEKDTLFLIALGPSAGVLAYDLFKHGYQALDIGHMDLEYEWFLNGTGGRSEVKHKFNNEFPGGNVVEEVFDENYLNQIICKIE